LPPHTHLHTTSSGFIALHATLGSRDVDCVLIPEIDFDLKGEGGLLPYLEKRLAAQGHVVIVLAEGSARNKVLAASNAQMKLDLDGNPLPAGDAVGPWLMDEIKAYFKDHPTLSPITPKFVNPSYMVRSIKANAADNIYCSALAHSAVHGAFAGITNVMVGPMNAHNTYVPLELVNGVTNVVSTRDEMWGRAVFSTGQPDFRPAESTSCHAASDTTTGGCTIDLKVL
jgi:6-phosphofructokinase 1